MVKHTAFYNPSHFSDTSRMIGFFTRELFLAFKKIRHFYVETKLHCKKNWIFSKPIKKGSVDAKSFQMSSNVERSNKKILRNLKRFFTWIHSRNLLHKTFLSFAQSFKRFRREKEQTLRFRQENTEPEGFA